MDSRKTDTRQIYIIGNPNTGKTTLFNHLTGLKQKVGNWAGVTVDKKQGEFKTDNHSYSITDLPGIYALPYCDYFESCENININNNQAIDEKIALKALLDPENNKNSLIINIIDASNLERNLYLTTQLRDLNIPMIAVSNMTDIAKKTGLITDSKLLELQLRCPVIPICARKKQGIDNLKKQLDNLNNNNFKPLNKLAWQLDTQIINPLIRILNNIKYNNINNNINNHPYWQALCLLNTNFNLNLNNNNNKITDTFSPSDIDCIINSQQKLKKTQDIDLKIAENRNNFITKCVDTTQKKCGKTKALITDSLDKLFLNKYLGLPLFLIIMYLMFEFSMTFGSALQPIFDDGSRAIFIDGTNQLGNYIGLSHWLTAILANGIGLGINTVLTFIPQIATLFLVLTFLEDSGYMARAAFVMDRVMQWVGLPGKAFVPLIVGFGCNVPSIMAARHLDSHRDRLLTIIMAPFMTCGARLAIFAVFTSAFFPHSAGLVMFSLYLIGLTIAILTGLIMKNTLLKGNKTPFIMELPIYHLPTFKILYTLTWQKLRGFVLKAGKIIIPICILLGTLNSIKINNSSSTYLAKIGQSITPLFEPIGIKKDNWPATVGLITGTLAKEVVVGSLNTLYSQNSQNLKSTENSKNTQNNISIIQEIKDAWQGTINSITGISLEQIINPLTANEADHNMSKFSLNKMSLAFGGSISAFAYLLFVLLYIPCVSTIAATYREANKAYAWLTTLWSISIAYVISCLFYQIASWIMHQNSTENMLFNIIPAIVYIGLFICSLKLISNKKISLNLTSNLNNASNSSAPKCASKCSSNGGCC